MRCRDCGRPILFMTNHKGRRVPCDVVGHPSDGNLQDGRYFDRYGGEYVLRFGTWAGPPPNAVIELYQAHTHNGRKS
jgi:hypothetical protein